MSDKQSRQQRLAARLRENLRRRKEQARAPGAAAPPPAPDEAQAGEPRKGGMIAPPLPNTKEGG